MDNNILGLRNCLVHVGVTTFQIWTTTPSDSVDVDAEFVDVGIDPVDVDNDFVGVGTDLVDASTSFQM